jgi:translation initiation factor 1
MSEKGRILYSSDGSGENLVKKNKKAPVYATIEPRNITLKLRIEKKGRGGKTVTVVYNLPDNPPYFKTLSKELKKSCGTGGSAKPDSIEIQGDVLDKVRQFLLAKGFIVKG